MKIQTNILAAKSRSSKPVSIKHEQDSHENRQKRTIASTELGCAGLDHDRGVPEPDRFGIHLRTGISNFHICPSPQMVPFRVPQQDLVLRRRREIHPKVNLIVDRRVDVAGGKEGSRLAGLLLVALVEPVDGGVAEGTSGVEIDEDAEVELNGVVFDALVLVGVDELKGEEKGGVWRGIEGFVEGRNVNGLDI
ncbi:hypothetical protein SESBI_35229 [Sesbania bispinosa]|nr:hypothetical protein SESBI_35229 [Sesbania bispinosa]